MANYTQMRVRLERHIDRSAGPDACHPWTGATDSGYGVVRVGSRTNGSRRLRRAHVLLYEDETGQKLPPGIVVRHRCDNPPCCNMRHLIEGTRGDNSRDMVERGRSLAGEENSQARLSNAQVADIRARYTGARGQQTRLAEEFGVYPSHVNRIVHGHARKEYLREPADVAVIVSQAPWVR